MWNLHGIEPDLLDYQTMRVLDAAYPLRPEIIESVYYLHQLTHEYLEMGRSFFEAITGRCRTDAGTTGLKDVVTGEKGDLMPSYYLAESLKYLYLLFTPDTKLDLDEVVFTTEAHPLRRTWARAPAKTASRTASISPGRK